MPKNTTVPDRPYVSEAELQLYTAVMNVREQKMLIGHTRGVSSAVFSPDGTRLVTASGDKTVRIWDAATGTAIATLTGHTSLVRSATFSSDGMRVVTTSADNTAQVWRIFRNTQELIECANGIVPRRLTPEERKKYFLE